MPIYTFKCSFCGNKFESFINRMKDVKSTIDCIKCGEIANKIISPVNVIYKGKGFYNTDNKVNKSIKEEGEITG